MLFFFEAGFFGLAVATIALAELVGRTQALTLWAAVTTISLLANPLVQRRLARHPPTDPADAKYRQLLAESWRHFNRLLLAGLVLAIGYWLLAAS
jgi:hypothetical protein